MDPRDTATAIRAVGLTKRYGALAAVDGLALAIGRGELYGLLGPNGAGKTTAVHMLSTLIRPTSGEAWVAGHSVLSAPVRVRAAVGVVFQDLSLDLSLTVAENLRFAGMLNDLSRALVRSRTDELLALFGLDAVRGQPARSLSGGMRRALDIARGVMHHPRVLFLDEPTIGLDLPNRRAIWRHVASLRADLGTTVVLTTHYLQEAEACDRVGFIDHGRLVREGVPAALTAALGRFVVEMDATDPYAVAAAAREWLGEAIVEGDTARFCFAGDAARLVELQDLLRGRVRAMRWRRPTLDDVFVEVLRHPPAVGVPAQGRRTAPVSVAP